ncbi:MAG: tripartite tricarboxylate transporter substrate binding protein [Betaproteobacteria bacterium]|nr:tripartite tricarboxylate transporter substrate binding protein [Betaproteobacteria bacterium]
MMRISHARLAAAAFLLLPGICGMAWAQYPTKPVRIIVGFPPGGGIDIISRTLADRLAAVWGQAVVVENRPGASGIIAAEQQARAAADGYTLMVTPSTVLTFAPALYEKLPVDVARDFAPISQLAGSEVAYVVSAAMSANTLQEFVALAKQKPGAIAYATTGNAGLPYVASLIVNQRTGMNLNFVSYKGVPQALNDLLGGNIQLFIDTLPGVLGHVKTGKLKVLAVLGQRRASALPNVPTIAEAGVADATGQSWNAMLGRANTPVEIIRKINTDVVATLRRPEVIERLASVGFDTIGSSPDELAAVMKSDLAKWGKVIRDNNIKPE